MNPNQKKSKKNSYQSSKSLPKVPGDLNSTQEYPNLSDSSRSAASAPKKTFGEIPMIFNENEQNDEQEGSQISEEKCEDENSADTHDALSSDTIENDTINEEESDAITTAKITDCSSCDHISPSVNDEQNVKENTSEESEKEARNLPDKKVLSSSNKYFDHRAKLVKLPSKFNTPIIFFEDDFELPEQIQQILERYAYDLAIGKECECNDIDQQTERIITAWMNHIYPHLVLPRKEGRVDNKLKENTALEGKHTDERHFTINNGNSSIIQVRANLNNESGGFDLTTWHPCENIVQERSRIVSLEGIEGTCLAIHQQNKHIYVGRKDGSILIYSARTNKCLQKIHYHTTPVKALGFIDDGRMLVSLAEDDQLFVQTIDDYRPRISLDCVEHSKTYLCNQPPAIIRSHIGGKTWYMYGVDGVYYIPKGYISGASFSLRHTAYLYMMQKLQKNIPDLETVNVFYNSWVKNTFEDPIPDLLSKFLQQKAQDLGFPCPNNDLLLKDN